MSWSKVHTKFRKPLGWWYHKFLCETNYRIHGSGAKYYYHLNRMCDEYNINLYGEKIT